MAGCRLGCLKNSTPWQQNPARENAGLHAAGKTSWPAMLACHATTQHFAALSVQLWTCHIYNKHRNGQASPLGGVGTHGLGDMQRCSVPRPPASPSLETQNMVVVPGLGHQCSANTILSQVPGQGGGGAAGFARSDWEDGTAVSTPGSKRKVPPAYAKTQQAGPCQPTPQASHARKPPRRPP